MGTILACHPWIRRERRALDPDQRHEGMDTIKSFLPYQVLVLRIEGPSRMGQSSREDIIIKRQVGKKAKTQNLNVVLPGYTWFLYSEYLRT